MGVVISTKALRAARRHLLFLLLLPLHLSAQEADTLVSAHVVADAARPVLRPVEEVYLPGVKAPPVQVADVLRRFTGVQVKDYGGAGGLKTVNVRSLGSEHVGIFMDGIQIDNAQNMQVDLGRFSTEGLGSVSLYNGQKSRRLQTAKEYCAGAAVYMESFRPVADGGVARLRGGSFETVQNSLQLDKVLGRVAVRAAAEYLYSGGQYKFPYYDTTLVRENGDIRALRLDGQVFGSVAGGEWRVRLYSYGSERGYPGPVIRRAAGFPFSAERQADQDAFVQGSWTQEWTARYSTALRFKISDNYTHYDTHAERNPMAMPYDIHYRQRAGYVSAAQSFAVSGPWSVDLATDLQYNTLDSDVGQFVKPRRTTFNGALATRYAAERFRAGAHLAWLGAWDTYENRAGGWTRENTFRNAWMPSLSLMWLPSDAIELSAFAKRTYRLPTFNDLYYALMGNSALVPESATQYCLSFRASPLCHTEAPRGTPLCHTEAPRGPRVSPISCSLVASAYYNRVANKIVAIPTASQFRWTMLNIGIVDIIGIDLKATGGYQDGDFAASAALRYSFQRAIDHTDPEGQTYGNQIPYIPLHSGSIDLSLAWRAWTFTANTLLTGPRWSRTANIPDYYLAPWSTTDIALTYTKKLLTLNLNVNNLFNYRYQIIQGYPMPGTNAFLSATLRW